MLLALLAALGLVLTTALALSGCGEKGCGDPAAKDAGAKKPPEGGEAGAKQPAGLSFRLSKGEGAGRGRDDRSRVAAGEALPAGVAGRLLQRMRPLAEDKGDQRAFALRARSLPPPTTGKKLTAVFPPPVAPRGRKPAAQPAGSLKVLRQAPEGKVNLAPHLSVTFSQPMVAVTSHTDAVASNLPVALKPALKDGKWRWIGTRTLLFEPAKRFPMATRFEVTVKQGARSALGGTLAAAKSWSFSTPAPRLIVRHPVGGPQPLDPVIVLGFDQRIDPDKVAARLRLVAAGKELSLRRLSEKEIAADAEVSGRLVGLLGRVRGVGKERQADRWLALRPAQPLRPGTAYTVAVRPGLPSAEGPLVTEKDQSFSFATYEPLAVQDHNCPGARECRPLGQMWIRFNNPLDEEAFDEKAIKVQPELPEQRVTVRRRWLYIAGQTRGRTTYRVALPASLKDAFGQTLGSAEVVSFAFGKARPRLMSMGGMFRTLDPRGARRFRFRSINHRSVDLRVYQVEPKDWGAFRRFVRQGIRQRPPEDPPGKLRISKQLQIKGDADALTTTEVDLRPALSDGKGQLVVLVRQRPFPQEPYKRQYLASWIQVSELALDAFVDRQHLLGWVSRLRDGKAIGGAKLSLVTGRGADTLPSPTGAGPGADTADSGLGRLALPTGSSAGDRVLVGRTADDLAMLPENGHAWGSASRWHRRPPIGESVRWYVFDDRKLYRPKEQVRVKGWVRLVDMGATAAVRQLPESARRLTYRVVGPRGNEIGKGSAAIGPLGGFDLTLKLSDRVNLGRARLVLSVGGVAASNTTHTHAFRIQEFKRPEFEVASSASEGPHLIGGFAEVTLTASYFSGGGLSNAAVRWNATASAGSFTPPGLSGYSFVGWRPSWWRVSTPTFPTTSKPFSGRTDGKGRDRLRIDFDGVEPARPASLRVAATVQDVNRQTWSTAANLLVHPASHYVGLKTERYFVKQGKPMTVAVVVADLDGKRIAGSKATVRFVRLEQRYERGAYKTIEHDEQRCEVLSLAEKDAECTFQTHKGGTHLLSATIKDKAGRKNRTDITRWVTGGRGRREQRIGKQQVQLIADRDSYQPGDKAQILVQAPFAGAEGLLTLRRAGIKRSERFKVAGTSHTLTVPIGAEDLPSLNVQVDLVGAAEQLDEDGKPLAGSPPRPAFASGAVRLKVPPLQRRLKLAVEPAARRLAPGGKTRIAVSLTDAGGKPVAGGEVALAVVDEAVLALTGYKLSDPLPVFYPVRSTGVSDHHLRQWVQLAELKTLVKQGQRHRGDEGRMGGSKDGLLRSRRGSGRRYAVKGAAPAPSAAPREESESDDRAAEAPRKSKRAAFGLRLQAEKKIGGKRTGPAQPAIAVRADFRALALFAPALRTDDAGRATAELELPDSLTRYRVMAVGVGGAEHYGLGESSITARMPLAVKPAAPRFLNFGDRVELPVVVHNRTDQPLAVSLALRSNATVKLLGLAGRRVTVPPDDRLEVRFSLEAVSAGTARLQVAAEAGAHTDAAELSLPVWTPATTEAFATYGTVDEGVMAQPVRVPKDVVLGFGGLQVSTSSTALQALTDALLYLVSYRFECAEQLSSRVLAVAALRDVLTAFKAPGLPPAAQIEAAVARDLKKLKGMQNSDGGFPLWVRGHRSWPFASLHVTHALVRAKDKGYAVDPSLLQRALQHAKRIERYIPSWYGSAIRRAIVAYSLYVRALAGDADVPRARKLYAELKRAAAGNAGAEVRLEPLAWLYPVLSGQSQAKAELAEIRRLLGSRVSETAATAQFTSGYDDGAYLLMYSSRRLDALLLEGLIKDQPKSDLIIKLVRGLLGHRKRGRWGSTQENAWVLLALDRYFRRYERVTPRFVARVWLGDRYAGEHAFRGRTTEQHRIEVPMRTLAEVGGKAGADLLLQKRGPGRLYYRIGMRYAPADLKPPPASHGFTVRRSYEAMDDVKDVSRDQDGTWRVRAGTRVRVRVTMVAPARRYHVALVDPLPAGFEALNPVLRGTQRDPGALGGDGAMGRFGRRGGGRFARQRYLGGRRGRWGWGGRWYEHHNLRDERAEAFASLVWSGVHRFAYVARATTPGRFVIPPPKAEEMYHPETFGRGPGDRMIIE